MTRSADRPDPGIPSLRELQMGFAAHIRDPEHVDRPADVEDRRMKIYRELFFNNIRSLLSGNFPVLRSLYDDDRWSALVREFYTAHRCHTPMFPEVPKEFLRYLQDGREPRPEDPPFLHELAHYEWVELALSLDERTLDSVPARTEGDLLEEVPVLSPLAWPLSYRYPVHRVRPDFQPGEAPEEASHLLVYRNRRDDVKFMQLNAVSRLLIALMQEHPDLTGRQLLDAVVQHVEHLDSEHLMDAGAALLESFRDRDILLGTRPA